MPPIQLNASFSLPPGKQVFFDTNIWLTLFGPDEHRVDKERERRAEAYATFYCRIMTSGSILTSNVVLSEFINRLARFSYDLAYPDPGKRPSFKVFRNSKEFKDESLGICANARRILKNSTVVIEPAFIASEEFWSDFASGRHDFNDQLIYQICRHHNCILVTDDSDMRFPDIEILTANRKMLFQA